MTCASCHSFQHDREADCSSVPSTMLPASQKPMGWDSNIEFAEGHKYWQCSAAQFQPNDSWWNVEYQRCRSPFATIVGAFPFFCPLIFFFQMEPVFWFGQYWLSQKKETGRMKWLCAENMAWWGDDNDYLCQQSSCLRNQRSFKLLDCYFRKHQHFPRSLAAGGGPRRSNGCNCRQLYPSSFY